MTNYQNTLVALILFFSLLCGNVHSNEPDPKDVNAVTFTNIGENEQVTEDALTITIAGVSVAKDFMYSIPNLKSLSHINGVPGNEILECVGGVIQAMNNVLREMRKMENSFPSLNLGTDPLKNVVDVILSYNAICERALGDVDSTIKLMVQRKIEDVVLLSNDVMLRLSKLIIGGSKENP